MQPVRAILMALFACVAGVPAVAHAVDVPATNCVDGQCTIQLTAAQLLSRAELLVSEHRFAEAAPLLKALENAPQFAMQRQFLAGYAAAETGDLKTAVANFRTILSDDPHQTRVRLELARALMLQGKLGSADHHFQLAQQDHDLPPEIAATIRSTRGILHDERQWSFNFNAGFAPDTNISNGTNVDTINVNFGNQIIPLTLDPSAKAQSGIGQTLDLSGSARLPLGRKAALVIEADSQTVNYSGTTYDDIAMQLAVGPQFLLSENTNITLQAVGANRWFGGKQATLSGGLRASIQHTLGEGQRIGFTIDSRHATSGFSNDYSGWQTGAYASYERVISRAMIASASLFFRRESLNGASSSSTEFGANIGIGGELPLGINAGLSAGVSRARFDAPIAFFGGDPRSDWRLSARAHIGLRSLRLLGFSPSVTYTYSGNQSSLALYQSKRSRFRFELARYF